MADVESKGDVVSGDATQTPTEKQEQPADIMNNSGDATENNSQEQDAEKTDINYDEVKPKIIKQMEYYFGDINLAKDRFLKDLCSTNEGWVESDTMLKFNRLKEICSEWELIAKALKEASELVEVSEDGKKVRRTPSKPLPLDSKERREEIAARTIYCKRFPIETKLDDLMSFFEAYGPIETLFMKKDFHKHTFKGSVFVTYKCKADAQVFLDEDDTKFNELLLEAKLWKSDYFKSKPGRRRENSKSDKKDKDDTETNGNDDSKKKGPRPEVDGDDEETVKQQMTKGAVLHISGMHDETQREEVRELFTKHGDVSWVDFDKGVTEGYIRLKEPNSAAPALESLEKSEGGIVLHDTTVTVRVVEGDEEVQYWQKMYRDIAERKINKKKKFSRDNRRGGRGGRGGRGRGRGGYQGKRRNDDDGPPNKSRRYDD